jgi:hypothetical protein
VTQRTWAVAVLGVVPAMLLAAVLFVPPVTQDPGYHDFAGRQKIWRIPNFWNVLSNAAFLAAAAFGARALGSREAFSEDWERIAFGIVVAGTVLVAFGSAYYHLTPNSQTLFWDRLPMTVVFMSLFAAIIGERIDMQAGRRALFPLLAIGALSVIYWRFSGDLRFYAMVQFYPMLAIPALLLGREARYSSSYGAWIMIAFYAVAKLFEYLDRDLMRLSAAGGHPWKHLFAAAAIGAYMIAVGRRRRLMDFARHV